MKLQFFTILNIDHIISKINYLEQFLISLFIIFEPDLQQHHDILILVQVLVS